MVYYSIFRWQSLRKVGNRHSSSTLRFSILILLASGLISIEGTAVRSGTALRRYRRTLLIIRDNLPGHAKLGSICQPRLWRNQMLTIYRKANTEGDLVIGSSYKLAERIQKRLMEQKIEQKDLNKLSHDLCIGKNPMKCNAKTKKCVCLNLPPQYIFVPEDEKCKVGLHGYCNPLKERHLTCKRGLHCISTKCVPIRYSKCNSFHFPFSLKFTLLIHFSIITVLNEFTKLASQ